MISDHPGVGSLLGACVLGDGLCALRDGVLGQLPRQKQPDGGLDLPGGDGRPLVVVGKLARFGGDPLKKVVDEGVHDAHGLGGDASVRVNLLQHLVDVDGVGLLPLSLLLLLVALGDGLGGLARLGSSLTRGFRRHLKLKLVSAKEFRCTRLHQHKNAFRVHQSGIEL